jgi:acyl-CoA reductase-like NAD-dependent aldehyde dehydrogenase
VTGPDGALIAHVPRASRKDARDAVRAARAAFAGWAAATAYNRGQVIYRIAEMLDARREQITAELAAVGDEPGSVDPALDRLVWYAGWADKYAQAVGGANPVAGPYFNFSLPEPTGVVAVIAPQSSSLLGLVSVLVPVITTGNGCDDRLPGPAAPRCVAGRGVRYLRSAGRRGQHPHRLLGGASPWLASHHDVNAMDLTGVGPEARGALREAAADTVKRVYAAPAAVSGTGEADWTADPGTARLSAFTETKTVWHPLGI